MEAISGVFKARKRAEDAAEEVRKTGVAADKITLLIPGTADQIDKEMQAVPVDTAEQPGMGKGLGALAGGGVGIAGGALLVALVPGVGPITAVGLLGAAILGPRARRLARLSAIHLRNPPLRDFRKMKSLFMKTRCARGGAW